MNKVRAGQASTKPRCAARRTDGKPCGAYAQEGSTFCLWHDPNRQLEAAQTRSKGGKVKAGRDLTPSLANGERITLATPADALAVLERVINDLYTLENSIGRARAVIAGVAAFGSLYQSSVMEARIAALEQEKKERESQKTS